MYERVAQIGVDTAQGGHDGTVPRALLARSPAVSSPPRLLRINRAFRFAICNNQMLPG